MPSTLRLNNPDWICLDYGDMTLVINNAFAPPRHQLEETFLRIATPDDFSSTEIVELLFPSTYETYVPALFEEIITHPQLSWLQEDNFPITLIYNP